MNLRNILTITKRELGAYFNSAIAYIFIVVFILISVNLYMIEFFLASRADMRSYFGMLPSVLAIFLPAVTMRSWAEDRRGNTLELLLTFPMKTHELVLGKFMAAMVFFAITLMTTLIIPLMLVVLGNPDFGPIAGAYAGSLALSAFFIAIGMFLSGLCKDQIVAFILTLIVLALFVLIGVDFVAASIDGWWPGFGTFIKQFLGVLPHFTAFARGVIDVKDILYFIVGTVIFLVLNGFWLEGRMRPKAKAIFSIACVTCALIFVCSNWLVADINLGRTDLTRGKIYTVSDVSQKILQELKAPLLVKYYVSPQEKMPSQLKSLEQDVVDKLEEFRIAGQGKFSYKIFHLDTTSAIESAQGKEGSEKSLEAQLEKKGIQPFRVQSIEADQMGVKLIYSSMALAYKEKAEELIDQVIPQTLNELEYLILSKAYRMTLEKSPKVAVVAPYEQKSIDPQMAMLLAQLGGGKLGEQYMEDEYRYVPAALEYAGYEMSRIRLTKNEPIPEGVKTLVVIHPTQLNERQRYEINRFLNEGGSVFLGVQNYSFDYRPSGRGSFQVMAKPENPGINELIEKWGIKVDESILMDQQSEVISMQGGMHLGPFALSVPVQLPIHILISQHGMNDKLSITSNLSPILYLWGGALEVNETKLKELSLQGDVLFSSSSKSWKVAFNQKPLTERDLDPTQQTFAGPYPAAILVKGQFSNAFSDRKTIPLWPEEIPQPQEGVAPPDPEKLATPAPAIQSKPGQLIVVGASTIFRENLMSQGGGPISFFMNSIDALTLSEDLTKIRGKQEINRLINQVSPGAKVFWRFVTTLLIPILLILIGTTRYFLRRSEKIAYLKKLSLKT